MLRVGRVSEQLWCPGSPRNQVLALLTASGQTTPLGDVNLQMFVLVNTRSLKRLDAVSQDCGGFPGELR